MMDLYSFFQNPCVQNALLAGFFAAIIGGMVGTFVVVKRLSFISSSIAHAVISGIGAVVFLERVYGFSKIPPIGGALCAAIFCAVLIAKVEFSLSERVDSIIALIFAAGMAIGIVLIAKTPGYVTELNNVLIGNIVWISKQDVLILGILLVCSFTFIALRFEQLKLLCFDKDQAYLRGINVFRLYTGLLILVALTVVALMQVVGIVLVMTMLTLPQLLAGLFCTTLFSMILWSCFFSVVATFFGLYVAYIFDIPPGASIALFSAGLYGLGRIFKAK